MGKRKYGHLVTKLGAIGGKPRLDCARCRQGECVRHGTRGGRGLLGVGRN